VKSFADYAFMRLFDELLRRDKPKEGPDKWSAHGVDWQHSRHSFETNGYGFSVETYELVHRTKDWTLLVIKDRWWAGRNGEVIRTVHWGKVLRGNRATVMAWLKTQQREIEGRL